MSVDHPTLECWEPPSNALQHKQHTTQSLGHHLRMPESTAAENFLSHPVSPTISLNVSRTLLPFLRFICFYFMYGCFACMCVCEPDWCLQSPEKGTGFLRTGAQDGSKPLCGCWESNLGPLKETGLFIKKESCKEK